MGKIIIILYLFFLSLGLIGCDQKPSQEIVYPNPKTKTTPQSGIKTGIVKVGNQVFHVELAGDDGNRRKGLMFREKLEPGSGMFFLDLKRDEKWPVWMKNTLIPLDIVWLTEDLEVADFQTAPPCEKDPCPQYVPKAVARYILEVNAGEFRGRIGDRVEITTN